MKTVLLMGLSLGLSACDGAVLGSGPPNVPPDGGSSLVFGPGTVDDAGAPTSSIFAVIGPLVNNKVKPDGQAITIVMMSSGVFGYTCSSILAAAASNREYPNIEQFLFSVENPTGPVTPGTYSVVSDQPIGQASADLDTTDSACHGTDLQATSGGVTISEIANNVTGSYELTFGTRGSFSGQFIIPLCTAPAPTDPAADAGPVVCL